jgi:hypothetical protein
MTHWIDSPATDEDRQTVTDLAPHLPSDVTLVTLRDALLEGEPSEVLDQLAAYLTKYVVLPNDHAVTAIALWVVHCHLIDTFDSTPRLAIMSPEKGCGKSRVQEITEPLVPVPLRTSTVTPAVLFREIGSDNPPVVFIDEVDTVWNARNVNEELRAIINAGHRRGNDALRMVGEGSAMTSQKFQTFAPICLAGIGELPDTIADRSIIITMSKRLPTEKIAKFRFKKGTAEGNQLREKIAAAAATLSLPDDPHIPDGVEDRPADVWEPLLAIAEAVGGEWHRQALTACEVLTAAEPSKVSTGVRLLTDLRAIWLGSEATMPTSQILMRLQRLDESPWGLDPVLTSHRLASILRRYGIKPHRSNSERYYQLSDFQDPWNRYCPTGEPT